MSLNAFREELQGLMQSDSVRPFTCYGSPLACRVFLVGLNSATSLNQPFFDRYWTDTEGFLRDRFESDYLCIRKKGGVRPRIEALVEGIAPLRCLETNIYAVPSRKASQLRQKDKDSRIFEYLLKKIQPLGIVAHSNEPIDFSQVACRG